MAAKSADAKSGAKPAKKLQTSDYVHLHNHTQFSLLDGLTKIPELVKFANETGMEAVAMTDHGTLSGTIEFYKECKDNDVKPIIGIETYVAARKHTDKDPQKDKNRYHLILLAMNDKGYQNLMQLSTRANLDGFYYFPRVDHDLLEKYNEGIIALSACLGGEIGDALKNDDYAKAKEVATWYKSVFGDRYYLEIQDHGHPDAPSHSPEQKRVNDGVFQLSEELDIPVALTCDAHYLRHADQDAHEILLCVGTGAFLSDEKRMSLKDYELHVIPPEELIARWGKTNPEVIITTKAIADRCNVTIKLGHILIPKFPVPDGETEKSYLDSLTYRGLAWRYGTAAEADTTSMTVREAKRYIPKHVLVRAEYELDVIEKMGFNGYFLIIQDFINWGKDKGIVFGPGRGSAAGSIISYALKITELDPLKYDLLFERFLNPDRISMPDVDIDIQDTRRDEVIAYCAEKYGHERVANIVTFGRMFARNAVRDVARVLEVPYGDADRLAKMIPAPVQGRHIPLATSIQQDPDLKREYETNETSKTVIDYAVILEGTVRSHGVHAAGVVIAPDDIVKFVPLEMAQKGVVSTQYPMGPIEELGLLKMDFLGLSNLTIIKNALRIIKRVYGKDIDITTIPLDDQRAYELLARGDTTGVFQLESAGMKRYLRELKPSSFDDIIAMVALYRPGPMQFIDSFIKRKFGQEDITYLHEGMRPALENTYGILVYQEQFMQISKDWCGFTGGQADTLRKAVGKKKIDLMRKMKKEFVDGAVKHSGADAGLAEKFWAQLEEFANYCFNKSHAACYGLIAYQTAYLKAYYPAAFMAALMTSDYDDTDRLSIEISECKKMGIQVLPPDVNESFGEFAVVPGEGELTGRENIRFGMNAVKNVGSGAVEEILRARDTGKFATLDDFVGAVNTRLVNRKAIESLAKAGAFDGFHERTLILHNIDVILAYGQRLQKERSSGQTDLFGGLIDEVANSKPVLHLRPPEARPSPRELLTWERELMGLYLSQQPLESFVTVLEEQTIPIASIKTAHDGKQVVVGGAITDARDILTKKGQKMAFVKIEGMTGEIELILFPSVYQQTLGLWERDRVVIVRGKVNAKDREGNLTDEVKILVDDAREITHEQAAAYQATGKKQRVLKVPKLRTKNSSTPTLDAARESLQQKSAQRLYIRIKDSSDTQLLAQLKALLDSTVGNEEVVLVLGPDAARQPIRLPGRVAASQALQTELETLVGLENVKLQ
ncbi:DNA polymerase III subunit alpha [Candidatus Saccharibacteria bacterium]|jgi:DNA polymerase-3 subunit alpha|nr:DNA polymerase III subunit alpha [Candidatus Saccharibacteria bacterium]